jgi:hypothetical protein
MFGKASLLHRFLRHARKRPRVALGAALFHGSKAALYQAAIPHISDPEATVKCLNRSSIHEEAEALALYLLGSFGRSISPIEC